MKVMPYVVQQGDYLQALAARHGFDADAVWNDASNKPLRDQGRTPHMLVAHDILYIPVPERNWLAVTVGSTNAFTATIPTVDLTIVLQYRGDALANEKCVVNLGTPVEMTSDGSGTLKLKVPVHKKTVVVEIPRLRVREVFGVGHLDPPTTPSGIRQRIANMDCGAFGVGNLHHPDGLADAISAFQKANGLEVTGVADEATIAKLSEVHGC